MKNKKKNFSNYCKYNCNNIFPWHIDILDFVYKGIKIKSR